MTSDQQFWLAMVAQLAALITGLVALWLKVDGVHHEMDGMKTDLVNSTRTEAHAKGVLDEKTSMAEQVAAARAAVTPLP